MRQAAATIRNLRPNLEALETQLSSINILGTQPLADAGPSLRADGDATSKVSTRGSTRSPTTSTSTGTRCARTRGSLDDLGDRTAGLAERVRSGFVQSGLTISGPC